MNKIFYVNDIKVEMSLNGVKIFTDNESRRDAIMKYLYDEAIIDRELMFVGKIN